MITILQTDKNYKQNQNYIFLVKNLEKMTENNNIFNFVVDKDHFISHTDLKIIKLLDILKKYDDDEIVMYIDAFDTLVEACDGEIEKKFLALDVDVLYSCEKNCWPNENLSKFFPDKYFLNSGTMIFKNKKYQQILEILSSLRTNINDDQYCHSIFAIMNLMNVNIKLDKSNEIFQCLWGYEENMNDFEKIDGRIKNKITNTFPCVFHGNGTGKEILKKLFEYDKFVTYKSSVSFLGFVEDKMGIRFMNLSFDKIRVHAEIKNTIDQIIYSNNLELPYNIKFYIRTGLIDNYTFTIYDMNNEILLQEKNF